MAPRSIYASTQSTAFKFACVENYHEQIWKRIDIVKSLDDCDVVPRFRGWEGSCGFKRLNDIKHLVGNDPCAQNYTTHVAYDNGSKVIDGVDSRVIYKYVLNLNCPFDLVSYFAARLSKFCEDIDIIRDFNRIRHIIRVISVLHLVLDMLL